MSEKKYTYFQYVKDMRYPIFIRLDLAEFTPEKVQEFLEQQQFSKISEQDLAPFPDQHPDHYRILTIKKVHSRVARHMGRLPEADYLGAEKITSRKGYRLYRFQGHGLMVYSFLFHNWELGVHQEFGQTKYQTAHRIILNRFLALALGPLGVCGFWGVCGNEGAVIMKKLPTLGEAIFIDLQNDCILTLEGSRPLGPYFTFIRLDAHLSGGSRRMPAEELLGLLSTHCVFFDYEGLSVPIRQMIHYFSLNYRGQVYPQSHFASQQKQVAV